MTELEAWCTILESMDHWSFVPYSDKVRWDFRGRYVDCLCHAIKILLVDGLISESDYSLMWAKIHVRLNVRVSCYLAPCTFDGLSIRKEFVRDQIRGLSETKVQSTFYPL